LSRLITAEKVEDKAFKIKSCHVFGQAFFQKGCATTVAPVDHAEKGLGIRLLNSNVAKGFYSNLFTKGLR